MSIRDLQERCGLAAAAKGFHDDRPEDGAALTNWQGNKLLLIVSEVVEAHDELRKGYAADETYYPTAPDEWPGDEPFPAGPFKPEGVPSELADTVIRVLDFAFTEGIDLEAIIEEKLLFNQSRPRLHDRKF